MIDDQQPQATHSPAAVPDAVSGVESPPNAGKAGLWYLQLLWRPSSFFRDYIAEPPMLAVYAAAWIAGISHAMERIDKSLLKEDVGLREVGLMNTLVETWSPYWLWVLAIGAFGGWMRYYFGGWWYRKRLEWCSVVDADRPLTRRVYVFVSLVDSVPLILYMVWSTLTYASPRAAYFGDDLASIGLLIFPFWASVVSYVGARTVFKANKGPAIAWFWAAPWALYSLAVLALVLGLILIEAVQ